MREPLELGRTLVATAGTAARIIVTLRDRAKDGTSRYHIAIVGLNLGLAGTLPVKPDSPVVERIATGMPIPATTLAAIAFEQGKVRVAIPLPFTLSNEPPNGGFTPAPLRTANPVINSHRPGPRSSATPAPVPSGSAPSSPVPSPAGTLLPQ